MQGTAMSMSMSITVPSSWVPGNHLEVSFPEEEFDDFNSSKKQRDLSKLIDLNGRSLEEVQREAGRITLGKEFNSFQDFDRCVVNHRAVSRYRTSQNVLIQSCRFGKLASVNSSKQPDPQQSSSSDHSSRDSDYQEDNREEEESDFDNAQCGPNKENTNGDEDDDVLFDNSIRELTSNSQPRQPLGELSQSRENAGRNSQISLPAGEKSRRKSKTGACGQFARFANDQDPEKNDGLTPCPWHVRCIRSKRTGAIFLTKCVLIHNFPQHKHKWRGPTSKVKWLAETLAPRVIMSLKGPVKELNLGFQQDYKRCTSRHQMWRAKDKVRDAYLGGQRKSFHNIPGLIDRLREVDPGVKAFWEAMEGSDVFHRAFICPSATRKALRFCQTVVCLDACHTKNRKYPTQIFLATALDGAMEVIPLCYGVAPTENLENWKWFLNKMNSALENVDEIHVPFISNRCKGLIGAVKDFPRFLQIIQRLEKSSAKGIVAGAYIRKLDAKLYARHAFPVPRFGHVTSNPCEATNSGLLPIRDYAPFKLLVEMWYYIQNHFNCSRRKADADTNSLTAPALLRHNENLKNFRQFEVFDDYGGTAKVQTTTGTEEYLVTKGTKPTCTCFELQEMVWPCEHIMAWEDVEGKSFSKYFHRCWRVQSLRKLYAGVVPSFLCNDIKENNCCWPPVVAVKMGRHRVVRITSGTTISSAQRRGADVLADRVGNLYMRYPIEDDYNLIDAMPTPGTAAARQKTLDENRRRKRSGPHSGKCTCSICGVIGHNKRTCPSRAARENNLQVEHVSTNRMFSTQVLSAEEMEVQAPTAIVMELQLVGSSSEPELERRGELNVVGGDTFHGEEDVDIDDLVGLYRSIPGYEQSDSEDDHEWHDHTPLQSTVKFGTTQGNEHPDWATLGYMSTMEGIDDIDDIVEHYDHPSRL